MAEEPGPPRRGVVAARFRVPSLTSFARRRVHDALRVATSQPLTLVSAPAGAGKTTAVAAFVRSASIDHTWYRAGAAESEADALLEHLDHAMRSVVPGLRGSWTSAAVGAIELSAVHRTAPVVLVVDDLHELRGSAGEQVLSELIDDAPEWLHVLAMGREPASGLDLARRRVAGGLAEIGPDVLRWRPWEVAELFREFYHEPLRPEDAARLTHRTGGWSAGLQLFHHATRQLPLASRTRLIDDLHTRPGLVREYLARHVLSRLPTSLRDFLVDTCVLGRLDAGLCDDLRGRTDSAAHLAELTERQLFMLPQEDGRGHHYHEVLRAHLHLMMVERDGVAAARAAHHRAGRLLEAAGAVRESVHAYARAEAWDHVRRVLGTGGPVLASGMTLVALQELPAGLVATDPWLQLARARALAGDGRLDEALGAYADAENCFESVRLARVPRDERRLVRVWTSGPRGPARHPLEHLRDATVRDPGAVATRLAQHGDQRMLLVAGCAALLDGDHAEARRLADRVGARAGVDILPMALARVLGQLADAVGGTTVRADELDAAADTLEALGLVAVARVVRRVASCQRGAPLTDLLSLATTLHARGDRWGAALVELTASVAAAVRGSDDVEPSHRAVRSLDELGAPVLAAWAALTAPSSAPSGRGDDDALRRATAVGINGAASMTDQRGRAASTASPSDPWHVRLHGGMQVEIRGGRMPLEQLRPKSTEGLALFLVDVDRPLHEDHLMSSLWPGVPAKAARHRLQVLVSTLRGFVVATGGRRDLIARRGQAYVLSLPPGSTTDRRTARQAYDRATGPGPHEPDAEAASLSTVVAMTGPRLLPELPAVDWLVDERDRASLQLAHAARRLAELRLDAGDVAACIRACRTSLEADRFSSTTWRLLARAHEQVGDRAAAAAARRQHRDVLAQLGLPAEARTRR